MTPALRVRYARAAFRKAERYAKHPLAMHTLDEQARSVAAFCDTGCAHLLALHLQLRKK